jgi:hypothetical protein
MKMTASTKQLDDVVLREIDEAEGRVERELLSAP